MDSKRKPLNLTVWYFGALAFITAAGFLGICNTASKWAQAEWDDFKGESKAKYIGPAMRSLDQIIENQKLISRQLAERAEVVTPESMSDDELRKLLSEGKQDREHFRKQMQAYLLLLRRNEAARKTDKAQRPAAVSPRVTKPVPVPQGQSGVNIGPDFVRAVHLVETGGRLGPIVGDGGASLGPLQISEAAWKDAKQYDQGVCDKYEQVADFKEAEKVLIAYLSRWGEHFHKEHGVWPGYITLAQIWNGGPKGYAKKATLNYAYEFGLRLERTRDWWHAQRPNGGDPLLQALELEKANKEFARWYERTHPDRQGVHRVGREGRSPEVGP